MTIRAIRQYPRLESLKTLGDAEAYLRKLLIALQEEAVVVSTLYRTFVEGIIAGDEFSIIEFVDSLPAAGTAGRVVYLTTDKKIYIDNGTAWVVLIIPASVYLHIGGDGEVQIVAGQIATNTITVGQVDFDAQLFTDGTVKTNIENWIMSGHVTYIDGGKIWTGTITADQIFARTITADEIKANTITIGEIAVGTIPDVSCRVYLSNAASPADSTWTKVSFNVINHDTHSGHDVNTGIYTVQVAGTYLIHANIRYGSPVADKRLAARIEQNDTVRAYSDAHTSCTDKCSVQVLHVIALAVDDEVHIETYHNCGGLEALDPGNDDTYMEIHLLHH